MGTFRGLLKLFRTRQIPAVIAVIVFGLCTTQVGQVIASPQAAAGELYENRAILQLDPTRTPADALVSPGPDSAISGEPGPAPAASMGSLADPLVIPGRTAAEIDATCFGREYRDGISANFVDGNGATGVVYLKHDEENLYVCMIGAVGSYDQRFTSVYLDPDLGGGTFPQADDLSFRANLTGQDSSVLQGGGAPGYYIPISLAGWRVETSVSFVDVAEYQIPLTFVGCGSAFGLAVYHHWFAGISNDYGWPVSQYWDQPQTWAVVRLDAPKSQGCTFLPVVSS